MTGYDCFLKGKRWLCHLWAQSFCCCRLLALGIVSLKLSIARCMTKTWCKFILNITVELNSLKFSLFLFDHHLRLLSCRAMPFLQIWFCLSKLVSFIFVSYLLAYRYLAGRASSASLRYISRSLFLPACCRTLLLCFLLIHLCPILGVTFAGTVFQVIIFMPKSKFGKLIRKMSSLT